MTWRGGRVDEGGRLEIYCGPCSPWVRIPPSPPFELHAIAGNGGVTEWTKVHDWKSCVRQRTVGSNPTPSAIPGIAR